MTSQDLSTCGKWLCFVGLVEDWKIKRKLHNQGVEKQVALAKPQREEAKISYLGKSPTFDSNRDTIQWPDRLTLPVSLGRYFGGSNDLLVIDRYKFMSLSSILANQVQ